MVQYRQSQISALISVAALALLMICSWSRHMQWHKTRRRAAGKVDGSRDHA